MSSVLNAQTQLELYLTNNVVVTDLVTCLNKDGTSAYKDINYATIIIFIYMRIYVTDLLLNGWNDYVEIFRGY